jgi:hypothetical protein
LKNKKKTVPQNGTREKCLKNKKKTVPQNGTRERHFPWILDSTDIVNAEIMWLQAVQQKYFSEIFLALENPRAKISSFSRKIA